MPENHSMDFDTSVKVAVYRATAESGHPPSLATVATKVGAAPAQVKEAYARLRAAEALVREDRRAEADVELKQALAFWRSVGATAYVREAEALVAAAG